MHIQAFKLILIIALIALVSVGPAIFFNSHSELSDNLLAYLLDPSKSDLVIFFLFMASCTIPVMALYYAKFKLLQGDPKWVLEILIGFAGVISCNGWFGGGNLSMLNDVASMKQHIVHVNEEHFLLEEIDYMIHERQWKQLGQMYSDTANRVGDKELIQLKLVASTMVESVPLKKEIEKMVEGRYVGSKTFKRLMAQFLEIPSNKMVVSESIRSQIFTRALATN